MNLVGIVWAWGLSKSQLLAGCQDQGVNSCHLSLGVTTAGCLLDACQEQWGAEVCLSSWLPRGTQGRQCRICRGSKGQAHSQWATVSQHRLGIAYSHTYDLVGVRDIC